MQDFENDFQEDNRKNKFKNLFKRQDGKRVIMLWGIIGLVLIVTVGFTYAIFNASINGKENSVLLAGDIYMHYKESPEMSFTNATPRSEYDPNYYFEFTIDGKNEYQKKPIWYDISLEYGDPVEGREMKIEDKFLRFRLVENRGGEDKVLIENKSYSSIDDKKIWVDTIPANTKEEIKITYRLYIWIGDNIRVGNTEDANYTIDEWNDKIYGSVKVKVTGDFNEKELQHELIETLKEKADKTGEIIAVDSNSNKCESISSCSPREYRFSGATANNYVKLNNNNQDELWRIIGIFKDEATGEEYIRIVRNEVLPRKYLAQNYNINGVNYKVGLSDEEIEQMKQMGMPDGMADGLAYWNYITGTSSDKNTWESAGLQYYLNTEKDSGSNKGYLSYLSTETKAMLRETKHYLGDAIYSSTPKEIFTQEHQVRRCSGSVEHETNYNFNAIVKPLASGGGSSQPTTCASTWPGTVGLMYASDYGFSASNDYWDESLAASAGQGMPTFAGAETSWMQQTMPDALTSASWLVSPSANNGHGALDWRSGSGGFVITSGVYLGTHVRPVLNLVSNVLIKAGNGESGSPYELEL